MITTVYGLFVTYTLFSRHNIPYKSPIMMRLLHIRSTRCKHFHVWIVFAVLATFSVSRLHGQASTRSAESPRITAMMFCGGCHQFPEPGMLDKETWANRVLPVMGWRLGIYGPDNDPYAGLEPEEKARVEALGIFPDKPLVTPKEWADIRSYFTSSAPVKLKQPETGPESTLSSDQFITIPIKIGDQNIPGISLLEYDPFRRSLFIGDARNLLVQLDSTLSEQNSWRLTAPPADICFPAGTAPRLLMVGSIAPTEKRNGVLFDLTPGNDTEIPNPPIVGMARPVHISLGDVDGDGTQDAVIAEFGHHSGQLTLFPAQNPDNPAPLITRAGARQSILKDIDLDGKMDILVLMAQSQEQIVLLKNLGDGKFAQKVLLSFSPLHGLSHMELKDMDGDGDEDLLVSNGDNWDFSAIRKPYHGVRIFLNDGQFRFKQGAFFPLPGASKAMAADLDGDGDQDIAAISFYDDPNDPIHGFLLLENQGGLQFARHLLPAARAGKWLTMDCADIDTDGRPDIILGSYFHNPLEVTKMSMKGITDFPHILILKNRWKQQ
jgi:hypothetical protein